MKSYVLLAVVGVVFLGCTTSKVTQQPASLEVYDEQGKCVLVLNGERIEPQTDADWSLIATKIKQGYNNEIAVHASTSAPYRCVGAAIFAMQRAGVGVGLVAQQPASNN